MSISSNMPITPISQTIVQKPKVADSSSNKSLIEKVPDVILQMISEYNTHTRQTAPTAHLVSKPLKPLFEKINLDLSNSKIYCYDLSPIIKKYQGRLNSLNLSKCPSITTDDLKCITTLKNLTSLNLKGDSRISDSGFEYIATLKNLTSLDLGACSQITNTGLKRIATLQNLTSLNLEQCYQITDGGLAHLATLQNLTSLNLAWSRQISDAGLTHLAKLQNLTSLNLGCTQITDAGLTHLAKLQNLTSLNLGACLEITDAGLIHLATLKNLTSLYLGQYSKITDAGIEKLQNLKQFNYEKKVFDYLNEYDLLGDGIDSIKETQHKDLHALIANYSSMPSLTIKR